MHPQPYLPPEPTHRLRTLASIVLIASVIAALVAVLRHPSAAMVWLVIDGPDLLDRLAAWHPKAPVVLLGTVTLLGALPLMGAIATIFSSRR